MPSPLAHATMGYVIYRLACAPVEQQPDKQASWRDLRLPVAVGLSLLPDSDSIVGFLSGDFGRYHNNASHSLVVGAIVALSVGGVARWRFGAGFRRWFLLALLCYDLHIIMDSFTISRGVMGLWPFSEARYLAPVSLFYGLHWSEGWFSIKHLWTLITELGFVALALLGATVYRSRALRYQLIDDQ
jgi:membrane-bound metal-dependent hydrolase YbcI (DUF457 family)